MNAFNDYCTNREWVKGSVGFICSPRELLFAIVAIIDFIVVISIVILFSFLFLLFGMYFLFNFLSFVLLVILSVSPVCTPMDSVVQGQEIK